MAKKLPFPTVTFSCPNCGKEHSTIIFGIESSIYVPCDCGRVIGYYVAVKK